MITKWVLIVRPKILKIPQNVSAQFVCLSPKVLDFNEKKLLTSYFVHSSIRWHFTLSCYFFSYKNKTKNYYSIHELMDYGLHSLKFTPTPKVLGMAEAYFVCHISPNFQISLIYAFIGCP